MSWPPAWDKAKAPVKGECLMIVRGNIEDNLLLTPQPLQCRLQQLLADASSLVLRQHIDCLDVVLHLSLLCQAKANNLFCFLSDPEVYQGIAIDPLLSCLSACDRFSRTGLKEGFDVLFCNTEFSVGIGGKPGALLYLSHPVGIIGRGIMDLDNHHFLC